MIIQNCCEVDLCWKKPILNIQLKWIEPIYTADIAIASTTAHCIVVSSVILPRSIAILAPLHESRTDANTGAALLESAVNLACFIPFVRSFVRSFSLSFFPIVFHTAPPSCSRPRSMWERGEMAAPLPLKRGLGCPL